MHATTKKSWAVNLQAAVTALNSTPKPAVLHGDAPAEVKDNPKVTFMLQQDQARDLQHNKKVTETKAKAALENTFRPQAGVTKFKRNYQATYGDPKTTAKVENGRVTATTGESYPLKRIKNCVRGFCGSQRGDHSRPENARRRRFNSAGAAGYFKRWRADGPEQSRQGIEGN